MFFVMIKLLLGDNMLNDLYSFSIMPLNLDYIDEICLDCKDQYETGVCSCVLFSEHSTHLTY